MKFRPFAEAREFVRQLGLRNRDDWLNYCTSGKKPKDIPSYPYDVLLYKKEWKGWSDWLDTTSNITSHKKERVPFEEARKIVLTVL